MTFRRLGLVIGNQLGNLRNLDRVGEDSLYTALPSPCNPWYGAFPKLVRGRPYTFSNFKKFEMGMTGKIAIVVLSYLDPIAAASAANQLMEPTMDLDAPEAIRGAFICNRQNHYPSDKAVDV